MKKLSNEERAARREKRKQLLNLAQAYERDEDERKRSMPTFDMDSKEDYERIVDSRYIPE